MSADSKSNGPKGSPEPSTWDDVEGEQPAEETEQEQLEQEQNQHHSCWKQNEGAGAHFHRCPQARAPRAAASAQLSLPSSQECVAQLRPFLCGCEP